MMLVYVMSCVSPGGASAPRRFPWELREQPPPQAVAEGAHRFEQEPPTRNPLALSKLVLPVCSSESYIFLNWLSGSFANNFIPPE